MWQAVVEIVKGIFKSFGRSARIEKSINDVQIRVLRLEILESMRRKDTRLVCELFDIYKSLNGNHYMDSLFNDYMKAQKKRTKKCSG